MNQLGAPAAMGFPQYLRTIPAPSNHPTYSHQGSEGSGQESSNQAATQRTKWSKPKDPSLIQKYGSKEIALDVRFFYPATYIQINILELELSLPKRRRSSRRLAPQISVQMIESIGRDYVKVCRTSRLF